MSGEKGKEGFLSVLNDQNSLLHKVMTYGVAVVMLIVCFVIARTSQEISAAMGTVLLLFRGV